jgi:hypothetical protein
MIPCFLFFTHFGYEQGQNKRLRGSCCVLSALKVYINGTKVPDATNYRDIKLNTGLSIGSHR